jgi:hypothetical protein
MPSEIRRKKTFGGVNLDHFSPELGEGVPPAINIHLSFEEALKRHLGLGQLLAHLNSYNRSTKAGRRSAANLCVYVKRKRITVNEGRIRTNAPVDNEINGESEQDSP